jgi:5-methylcytosine-specific restriction endonuclease McrA
MSSIRSRLQRSRLDAESYENLRQQVLRRDGRRCQAWATMPNLEVHHQGFRSRLGDDSEANLIALCILCLAGAHHVSLKCHRYILQLWT